MRLFLLTFLAMVAFAANSVLNRMAIRVQDAEPLAFAALRLFSGAAMLTLLCRGTFAAAGPLLSQRRLAFAGAVWLNLRCLARLATKNSLC